MLRRDEKEKGRLEMIESKRNALTAEEKKMKVVILRTAVVWE